MNRTFSWILVFLLFFAFLINQMMVRNAQQKAAREKVFNDLRVKSEAYMQKQMYKEAAVELTKLVQSGRNVYTERGACYFAQGLSAESLRDLNKAIEINGRDATAYAFRGLIHESQKEFDLALNDYNKAVDLNFTAGKTTLLLKPEFVAFQNLEGNFSSLLESALNQAKVTDLQQKDSWEKNYRGKKVLWACRVDNVRDEVLALRISASVGKVVVNVFLEPGEKGEALKLAVGQRIKVFGTLGDFGGVTAKYSIQDARIVDILKKEDLWPEKRDRIADMIKAGSERQAAQAAQEKSGQTEGAGRFV